ncbi:RNA-binding cell elongation regulator Jag/EloR [Candidatus Riflebacteria bacterium]
MRFVEGTGQSVEEAEEKAIGNASLEDHEKIVKVEVLSEPTKGLFGVIGSDGAKVKIHIEKDRSVEITRLLNFWIEKMGIEVDCSSIFEDKEIKFDLTGNDVGLLIGKYGKTLDAFQYLLNIAFNRHSEEKIKISLDVEGYRSNREKVLKNIARKAAIKVLNTGRTVELDPMTPLDRRIIHMALKEHSGVTTYSKGSEPRRQIIVSLKNQHYSNSQR